MTQRLHFSEHSHFISANKPEQTGESQPGETHNHDDKWVHLSKGTELLVEESGYQALDKYIKPHEDSYIGESYLRKKILTTTACCIMPIKPGGSLRKTVKPRNALTHADSLSTWEMD